MFSFLDLFLLTTFLTSTLTEFLLLTIIPYLKTLFSYLSVPPFSFITYNLFSYSKLFSIKLCGTVSKFSSEHEYKIILDVISVKIAKILNLVFFILLCLCESLSFFINSQINIIFSPHLILKILFSH